MSNSISATTTLNNGVKIPWLGLGTWNARGGDVKTACKWAIEAGYRHIDTAHIYENESEIGEAISECGIPRSELFITSKLWNTYLRQDAAACLKAFETTLKNLKTDYVDLYLIHWPVPGKYKAAWRVLEGIYKEKRARAIGVSNFMIHHLEDLLKDAAVVPAVNQVEFHVRLRQQPLLDYCVKHKIQHEAWSPLMRGSISEIAELREIAKAHKKTPEQIALRWVLQKGSVVIPKSTKKDRIISNAALFDFELSSAEMARIDALDKGERVGPDPDNFAF
jgi:diketogulonate reductase-like aldo/keto reductase